MANFKRDAKGNLVPSGFTPEAKKLWDTYFADGLANIKGGCLRGKKASTPSYHTIVRQKMAALNTKQKALEKLGVELEQVSEIEPLDIYGYVYDRDEGAVFTNDGWFTNLYEVTWIFFSDEQIYCYTYRMDTLCGETQETCREYFYKDVTSIVTIDEVLEDVETVQEKKGCLGGKKDVDKVSKRFKSFVRLVVPNDKFLCSIYPQDNTDIERRLKAAKAKLREKK